MLQHDRGAVYDDGETAGRKKENSNEADKENDEEGKELNGSIC